MNRTGFSYEQRLLCMSRQWIGRAEHLKRHIWKEEGIKDKTWIAHNFFRSIPDCIHQSMWHKRGLISNSDYHDMAIIEGQRAVDLLNSVMLFNQQWDNWLHLLCRKANLKQPVSQDPQYTNNQVHTEFPFCFPSVCSQSHNLDVL